MECPIRETGYHCREMSKVLPPLSPRYNTSLSISPTTLRSFKTPRALIGLLRNAGMGRQLTPTGQPNDPPPGKQTYRGHGTRPAPFSQLRPSPTGEPVHPQISTFVTTSRMIHSGSYRIHFETHCQGGVRENQSEIRRRRGIIVVTILPGLGRARESKTYYHTISEIPTLNGSHCTSACAWAVT